MIFLMTGQAFPQSKKSNFQQMNITDHYTFTLKLDFIMPFPPRIQLQYLFKHTGIIFFLALCRFSESVNIVADKMKVYPAHRKEFYLLFKRKVLICSISRMDASSSSSVSAGLLFSKIAFTQSNCLLPGYRSNCSFSQSTAALLSFIFCNAHKETRPLAA